MPADSYTPLTPLAFLERAADVFADKTAIAYGDRRSSYSEFGAEATRLAHALRASGVQRGDRVAYMCPNIPEMLVANFGVPLAGAVLVADQHPALRGGGPLHLRPLRGEAAGGRYRVPARAGPGAGQAAERRGGRGGQRSPRPGRARGRRARAHLLRRVHEARLGGAAAVDGRRRVEPDLDQLHLGDDRPAQGRDVHASRRVPERAGRDHPSAVRPGERLPVDAADVPLQRLVHTVGGDRRSARRTCACGRCART